MGKEKGQEKVESPKEGKLRVSTEWLKEVDGVVPKRERSEFIREAVSQYLAAPYPIHLIKKSRAFPHNIDWGANRADLDSLRAIWDRASSDAVRIIVLEAARKRRREKVG